MRSSKWITSCPARPDLFLKKMEKEVHQREERVRFLAGPDRPSRYEQPEQRWLELQDSLGRWGRGLSLERLQRLGDISKTDLNE